VQSIAQALTSKRPRGDQSVGPSSFSPLATMSSIPSGNGRCSFSAPTVSPSSQRSNSSVVVRSPHGFGADGRDDVVSIIIPVGVEQNLRRLTAPG
jgi:hypothetical protein